MECLKSATTTTSTTTTTTTTTRRLTTTHSKTTTLETTTLVPENGGVPSCGGSVECVHNGISVAKIGCNFIFTFAVPETASGKMLFIKLPEIARLTRVELLEGYTFNILDGTKDTYFSVNQKVEGNMPFYGLASLTSSQCVALDYFVEAFSTGILLFKTV